MSQDIASQRKWRWTEIIKKKYMQDWAKDNEGIKWYTK
jgi:hypothetical protein